MTTMGHYNIFNCFNFKFCMMSFDRLEFFFYLDSSSREMAGTRIFIQCNVYVTEWCVSQIDLFVLKQWYSCIVMRSNVP